MRRRKRILLLLAAGGLGSLAAEAVLRVVPVGPPPMWTSAGLVYGESSDPRLGVENVPGAESRTVFLDRRGEPVHEIVMRVNAQGFRGPEVARAKPAGTLRIACLGDSQTFGFGVDEERSWPDVLRAELARRPGAQRVEVLNCAVGGYETEREVAHLESRVLAFAPDLVLLGFFVNDTVITGVPPVEDPRALETRLMAFLAPGRAGLFPRLRGASRLVDAGADWLFRHLLERRYFVQRRPLYADDYPGWIRTMQALTRGHELVRARGARLAVVLVPLLLRDGAGLVSDEPYRKVTAYCRAEGIPTYDPAPLFADRDLEPLRVHPRDIHTGPAGQRILGEGVAAWLLGQGLLAEAPPR